jgi:hypothetical protein
MLKYFYQFTSVSRNALKDGYDVQIMSQKAKTFWAATVAVIIAFADFFVGCIYTEHWTLGIGFGKALNAFYHGLDDSFPY